MEGYKKHKFIRYIYGREFNCIYNYINKIKNDDNHDIIPFLKYITNNEKVTVNDFNWKNEGDEFISVINNFNNYIGKILKDNKIKLEHIYSNSLILSKFGEKKYKGFYLYSCGKVEKELFQLYKYLTGHIPIAQNILLCNKETSEEEIESFLYRAILCEFNSCFIIAGIESLKYIPKNTLIILLKKILYEFNDNMKSCLIIFSANKGSDIHKNLESIKYRKFFDSKIEYEIANIFFDNADNIAIISSDKSGIGKSTKIENEIKNKGKNYIYFPLGGVFNRGIIIERLKNLKITENSAIHLDLYDTDNIDLMQDFLFWIIVTKLYKQNEKIIYLPKNIEIKIEIPNGFIDFFEKFQILKLIPKKEQCQMSIEKLEPLIVPKDLDSNIQIVANYLKQKKNNNIDDIDLDFPGITPDDFRKDGDIIIKTITPTKVLSQEECQNLIFEIIRKNQNTSYYQIKSFIDVLSVQLKKFTQSRFFNANDLDRRGNNLKKLRTFVVDNFISLTKYFTEGAFTNLINEQNLTHKISFGQYDEGEDIENAIKSLAKNNHFKISFDNLDSSLVFFHEGNGEMFSIITNEKTEKEEYEKFLELKNSQTTENEEKIKKLPNYKEYKQIDFLRELKDILNIRNPVSSFKEDKRDKKEDNKNKNEDNQRGF